MIDHYFDSFYIGDSVSLILALQSVYMIDMIERDEQDFINYIDNHSDFKTITGVVKINDENRKTLIFERVDISVDEMKETLFTEHEDNILAYFYQKG